MPVTLATPTTPISTFVSGRGKGLTDAEEVQLMQPYIDNAEIFKYKTERQFWIDVSTDPQYFTESLYSDVSCQQKVEDLMARRKEG